MWTKRQVKKFETPNYGKEFVRKPAILKELGSVKGKKILEIGCGSGYWTRILAKKGAKVTGVDISEKQIKIAKDEEKKNLLGIKYFVDDASKLSKVKSKDFDMVFIEFVLLEIPKKKLLKDIFKNTYKKLKKGGILFISDMHPFDPIVHDRFELPKNFHYFKSGAKIKIYANQLDGTKITFIDYHWTLEDYSDAINGAGFKITKIKEPKPSKEMMKKYPYLKYRKTLPKDILIVAEK